MTKELKVRTEPVDDIPVLVASAERMGVVDLVDEHFAVDSKWQGLSLGEMMSGWLSYILSESDHRLNQVQGWAEQRLEVLAGSLGTEVRSLDFADDRLARGLELLSDDEAWKTFEAALNRRCMRVYQLKPERVRIDTTTGSGYWEITEDGYGSQVSEAALHEQEVTLIQTAIRGAQPSADKFSLSDFVIEQNEKGDPNWLTCPQGHSAPVLAGRTTGWQVRFDPSLCAACPFQENGRCRTKPQMRDPRYLLTFTTHEMRAAKRRKNYRAHQGHSHNLRSAVEATVRSVKHPFPAGKLPVRGQFSVTCMAIASAATTNARRIQRYLIAKMKQAEAAKRLQSEAVPVAAVSLFVFSARWLRSRLVFSPIFGY